MKAKKLGHWVLAQLVLAETIASLAITPVLMLYATAVCCVLSYVKDCTLFGTCIGLFLRACLAFCIVCVLVN